jgi:acetoacetyl-CoA synthetase
VIAEAPVNAPLWQPSRERVLASNLTAFARAAEPEAGGPLADYAALHRFSIEQPERFWRLLWRFAGVLGEGEGGPVLRDAQRMPGACWFPEARLNFAENLLRRRDDAPALIAWAEGRPRREVSHAALAAGVSRLAQALAAWGVGPGDRVAGFLPNLPEAVVAMLAATSLGAIWSSCSPDFGTRGVVDRFGQITPKILFAADGYGYAGKRFDSLARVAEIRREIGSLERVVIAPSAEGEPDLAGIPGAVLWDDALAAFPARDPVFPRFPFDHPLYVMFSSGTTGPPKCILHGAGGTLLQHRKEHLLHVDLKRDDKLFYFTTTGWMMWNWLVSALASDATVVLYDGSPFNPDAGVLFDLAQREQVAVFGTSAKFIDAAAKAGVQPARTHDLSRLRTVLSTGSPLAPEGFDWVYANVKADVQLASISGGTDIIACFVGGNPIGPVHRGEIQAPCLGMRVAVFDEQGRSLRGEKGELVCTAPFPSMPLGFWNDPDGRRFRAAYFEKHPGVWSHGDFAEITPRGGMIIHGRSDAVLNPGGVRIGTAEIYRQVEAIPEVLESLAIGQEWQGDTRVVLFVRLREGVTLNASLDARIRRQIRDNTTPRHVPAKIVQVADIPRTRSGKIVELAVRDVVHGRPVGNREALANPEALALYQGLAELAR